MKRSGTIGSSCRSPELNRNRALIPMLHTIRENSTQKTSLVGERAHLVYKPHISCPYNRCGTSPIPCNDISP
ncbi:hypothetical protein Hanom_Chr15g01386721 [Helianthus anomalus]